MSKQDAPRPRITLVYTGVSYDAKGSKFYDYYDVDVVEKDGDTIYTIKSDGNDLKARSYSASIGDCTPGGVFSIETDPAADGRVFKGTAKFLALWPDEAKRAQWITQSRANEAAHREAKRMKELMQDNAAVDRLEPIKQAYKRSGTEVRRQILAEVIRYITT